MRAGIECTPHPGATRHPPQAEWWAAVDGAIPRWQALQAFARARGIEVIYTVIQSLTRDGRDRSLDYKVGWRALYGSLPLAPKAGSCTVASQAKEFV